MGDKSQRAFTVSMIDGYPTIANQGGIEWSVRGLRIEAGCDVPGQNDTRPSRIIIEISQTFARDLADHMGLQLFPAPPREGALNEVLGMIAQLRRELDEVKARF